MSLRESVTRFCVQVGSDPLLVQAGGGNVSWKEQGVLWIKGSGMWLADAADRDVFAPVDLNAIRQALAAGALSYKPQTMPGSDLRPSIETLLHGLMPHRFVAHLHAVEPLAHLVRRRLPDVSDSDMEGLALVPYATPGEELAGAVAKALAGSGEVHSLLLANHGVVVGADDMESLQARLDALLRRFAAPVIGTVSPASSRPSSRSSSTGASTRAPSAPLAHEPLILNGTEFTPLLQRGVHGLATDPALYSRLARDWALYPDHVVFLGPSPLCVDDPAAVAEMNSVPLFFFLAGRGVFVSSAFGLAHQLQLQCYHEVLSRQLPSEPLRTLDAREVAGLLDWDAERYRQEMAARTS